MTQRLRYLCGLCEGRCANEDLLRRRERDAGDGVEAVRAVSEHEE